MMAINQVSKRFGRRQVLKNISLRLEAGVYGLLGPNGAGKTTLLRCMVGLIHPDQGQVLYQGVPIEKSKVFYQEMGYLPQTYGMFRELTLYEMMAYVGSLKGIPRQQLAGEIERVLEAVNLADRAGDRVKALSVGMIRRAGIAQALLGSPRLLLFDEPTAGLDPAERTRFKNLVNTIKQGRAILLSTHLVEDVDACCDRVIILDRGQVLFQGSCEELRRLAEGKVYQVDAENAQDIAGPHFTVRITEVAGRVQHRVVTRQPQRLPAVAPTLEDAYMGLIHGLC
ncbi:ABC transporter related protein [Thermaerobacter marianensis DSM 12885]|uniref:ABC transporter related protein n=1 Tax=Thermaerobacter marianensis (strain ATCC 700841 / DSM 12885 / JCM 10246 / 7p75a) TaxID=644966 RepID=E6SLX1_THEM7|nr:ATP-binding cassette domain-containing protein [Thermaerobacter marianensis]ADU51420.1 ABC transporter related protein [Thermaerobacter marianensis DSM 12885]